MCRGGGSERGSKQQMFGESDICSHFSHIFSWALNLGSRDQEMGFKEVEPSEIVCKFFYANVHFPPLGRWFVVFNRFLKKSVA